MSFINRIVSNPLVQSVVRHAAIAFAAGLVPVLLAGQPVSRALLVAAVAAALRAAWAVLSPLASAQKA